MAGVDVAIHRSLAHIVSSVVDASTDDVTSVEDNSSGDDVRSEESEEAGDAAAGSAIGSTAPDGEDPRLGAPTSVAGTSVGDSSSPPAARGQLPPDSMPGIGT